MANQEQLSILKQGKDAWKKWRQKHPYDQINLNNADLQGVDLFNIDLIGANLQEADLRGVNLGYTNLNRANLSGANLSGAYCCGTAFIGANLSDTNLSDTNFGVEFTYYGLVAANLNNANLNCADLNRAYLHRANLVEARLRNANLTNATLSDADLRRADLIEAKLNEAILIEADLSEAHCNSAIFKKADLREANLDEADLSGADLSGADLRNASLTGANLFRTDLSQANLSNASLMAAILICTNPTQTDLTHCHVYGISVWQVLLKETKQLNLIITSRDEPEITVDNLKIAQFIYLLLDNQEIRDVINTITTKVVLILGRFTSQRKKVLDALSDALRSKNYLPIVFDFEKPAHRDLTETISTLAHMARFVIADITDAKSIPQELERIVPQLPSVPVQPLLQARAKKYGMFEHFLRYDWVLEVYRYTTIDHLLASLTEQVIEPAEQKAQELEQRYHARTKLL